MCNTKWIQIRASLLYLNVLQISIEVNYEHYVLESHTDISSTPYVK